ncbi:HHR041Wp [Eremothecium sinecaudum]|uniref:Methionine--tRNA ligase, mitochondrial n=1 Tax=Eremothecium sinecaudum TaxID=45286 RepID=A0A0X8HWL6_9SACH|nr:HHR041Wp [Eremothecium sinecaudum]AMD22810.1 HHR041Wp [Eremothecium sinecaudum]
MVSHTSRILRQATKIHITTPIFYPNAKPHLGHLYSSLLCDVQARWNKLKFNEVLFTTGTDEHGLKIQNASENLGFTSPKDFVDKLLHHFLQLDKRANIEYTRFIRTTDEDHVENVKKLWKLCYDRGYIYKGTHDGWYSVADETFYPASKILQVIGEKEIPLSASSEGTASEGKYINTETRSEVFYQKETNYFFRLSSFNDQLIKILLDKPGLIYPRSSYNQVLSSLQEQPLQDLSISRPATRLKWGIPTPGDQSQRIYVWFDALCNYVTSIGGVDALLTKKKVSIEHGAHSLDNLTVDTAEWWSNTTHLIGKDIIRFHTIYWPAILLAAGLPLPNRIVVHGHWLSQGRKMSKSIGNVVDPIEMIERYNVDMVRWYILEYSTLESDGDFVEANLRKTRELLAAKWGNLVHRCGGVKFNISRAVSSFNGISVNDFASVLNNAAFDSLKGKLDTLSEDLDRMIENYELSNAVKHIWSIINDANNVVQTGEPWAKPKEEQDMIIYAATESARIAAIASLAFIPDLSNKLLDRLDVEPSKRSLEYIKFGADNNYGSKANMKGREVPIKRL